MGIIMRLDHRGHGPVAEWDPSVKAEIKTAEDVFKEHQLGNREAGIVPHKMYDVSNPQDTGTELVAFDPEATEILAVPQLVGG